MESVSCQSESADTKRVETFHGALKLPVFQDSTSFGASCTVAGVQQTIEENQISLCETNNRRCGLANLFQNCG